jgi:dipeptidase D
MSTDIKELEPRVIWEYFYQLTQIPRPSKHEEAVQEFMVKFGEGLGLETIKDEAGNVIIRKTASPGMEGLKGVILQGHLDMVPQANSDKGHDFNKDPISPRVDGDWVAADGTTLGADNGIGVAAAMAVLASKDIDHGPLEALFTADEESGMSGAFGLRPGVLQGDILLNMDSEDEGYLFVGCAGGVDGNMSMDVVLDDAPDGCEAYKLSVTGLKGGHSGIDIDLERGNAIKVLFRYLSVYQQDLVLRLSAINGGSLRNAIPREAFTTLVVPSSKSAGLAKSVAEFAKVVQSELASVDPDLKIAIDKADMPGQILSEDSQGRLVKAINGCFNGVFRMSQDVPGLVETSSNLAVVELEGQTVTVQCLLRSSVDSAKEDLANSIGSVFQLAGARVEFAGGYPGWKPNMESEILKVMQDTYQNLYGKVPEVKAIHAGLECGLLGGTYPHLDMISFGPTIRSPHSPDERVNIESVGKFYRWLLEALKKVPKKI